MNFVLLVFFFVLGAAHFTQSMAFDPYLEAEANEFESLRDGYVAADCIDPPPSAPDCRSHKKKPPPSATDATCLEREQLEVILKMLNELTPKLEAALKASKSKGASGAPAKDVKSAVEERWALEGGDLRNVHSGGRNRFRNRSPWRSEAD